MSDIPTEQQIGQDLLQMGFDQNGNIPKNTEINHVIVQTDQIEEQSLSIGENDAVILAPNYNKKTEDRFGIQTQTVKAWVITYNQNHPEEQIKTVSLKDTMNRSTPGYSWSDLDKVTTWYLQEKYQMSLQEFKDLPNFQKIKEEQNLIILAPKYGEEIKNKFKIRYDTVKAWLESYNESHSQDSVNVVTVKNTVNQPVSAYSWSELGKVVTWYLQEKYQMSLQEFIVLPYFDEVKDEQNLTILAPNYNQETEKKFGVGYRAIDTWLESYNQTHPEEQINAVTVKIKNGIPASAYSWSDLEKVVTWWYSRENNQIPLEKVITLPYFDEIKEEQNLVTLTPNYNQEIEKKFGVKKSHTIKKWLESFNQFHPEEKINALKVKDSRNQPNLAYSWSDLDKVVTWYLQEKYQMSLQEFIVLPYFDEIKDEQGLVLLTQNCDQELENKFGNKSQIIKIWLNIYNGSHQEEKINTVKVRTINSSNPVLAYSWSDLKKVVEYIQNIDLLEGFLINNKGLVVNSLNGQVYLDLDNQNSYQWFKNYVSGEVLSNEEIRQYLIDQNWVSMIFEKNGNNDQRTTHIYKISAIKEAVGQFLSKNNLSNEVLEESLISLSGNNMKFFTSSEEKNVESNLQLWINPNTGKTYVDSNEFINFYFSQKLISQNKANQLKEFLKNSQENQTLQSIEYLRLLIASYKEESKAINPQEIEKPFIIDGQQFIGKNKLRANIRYRNGEYNNHIYETDHYGRICKVRVERLILSETKRSLYSRPPHLYKIQEYSDEAGHLIADWFGGSGEIDNIVWQSWQANRVEFKKLEYEWAKALKTNKKVSVNIDINHAGSSVRPIGFTVNYTIGAEVKIRQFLNIN